VHYFIESAFEFRLIIMISALSSVLPRERGHKSFKIDCWLL
jgi:hypothetical protein